MVNAEKEIYVAHSVAGQNVDLDTPYLAAITNVAAGSSHGQREGETIKLHGFRWNLRIRQQASTSNKIQAKFWLVKYVGPRAATFSDIGQFLTPDFDGQRSIYSERNSDWFRSFKIICSTGLMTILPDDVSAQTGFAHKKKYGRFRGGVHQRYADAAASSLLTDQMYIIGVTSGGDTAASTALQMDSHLEISFYDN